MATIAEALNIDTDSLALIDDQAFEREEVRHAHPEIRCFDGTEGLSALLDLEIMTPPHVSEEQPRRRIMYREEIERQEAEDKYAGTSEEFLSTLDMELRIEPAAEDHLQRAEELTVRTHELNSSGITYSLEELEALRCSDDHLLITAELTDRFGSYGKIGLALVERTQDRWILKLLILSCRVMSRGIGSVLLLFLERAARDAGVRMLAEFRPTDRNRIMHITLRFAGFREIDRNQDVVVLEHDLQDLADLPRYIDLIADDSIGASTADN